MCFYAVYQSLPPVEPIVIDWEAIRHGLAALGKALWAWFTKIVSGVVELAHELAHAFQVVERQRLRLLRGAAKRRARLSTHLPRHRYRAGNRA